MSAYLPQWVWKMTRITNAGCLELTSAVLMARSASRIVGSLLASCIMAAAIVTVVFHGEYSHAIAPLVVLSLLMLSIYLHRK